MTCHQNQPYIKVSLYYSFDNCWTVPCIHRYPPPIVRGCHCSADWSLWSLESLTWSVPGQWTFLLPVHKYNKQLGQGQTIGSRSVDIPPPCTQIQQTTGSRSNNWLNAKVKQLTQGQGQTFDSMPRSNNWLKVKQLTKCQGQTIDSRPRTNNWLNVKDSKATGNNYTNLTYIVLTTMIFW